MTLDSEFRQPENHLDNQQRRLPGLDLLANARQTTVALIEGLDQHQLDAVPNPGRWSVGEILDHLIRVDRMLLREVQALVVRRRQGRIPFIYRGLRALGAPGGTLPLPFRLPIEGTLAFCNIAIPARLREWAFRQRVARVQAPRALVPTPRRGLDELVADLHAGVEEVRRLDNTPGLDLRGARYYSPLAGLNSIDGLVRLIAQHDMRHHAQLREARAPLEADFRVPR